MEAPWDSGALGAAYKQLSGRFFLWENLQGKPEKTLCPGSELLFLPGSSGLLPYRSHAGCNRQLEFESGLLRSRFSDVCRRADWTLCLRLAVSLWADSGSAPSNTVPCKAKNLSWREDAAKTEIRDSGALCNPAAHVFGGCFGAGCALLLQADLSGWHTGGRDSPCAFEPLHAQRPGLAVSLEKRAPADPFVFVHSHLPAILQIHMPPRSSLLHIQSHIRISLPDRQAGVYWLRNVRQGLQNEHRSCTKRQPSGVHPLQRL